VQTPIGYRIQPLPRGRIEGGKVGELQASEAMLFDRAYAMFHAAFFVALAHMAWGKGKAVVGGTVEGRGIEHGGFAQRALEHGGFQVIDHPCVGHAAKELQGVWMTGQEVLHGLGDGACHRQHTAVDLLYVST
jgi:hypothetical protein